MWIVYALLAALAGATMMILTKVGLKDADHTVALAIQSVLILAISWGAVTVRGQFGQIGNIDRKAWVCLLLAGVVTSASYLLLFQALKLGDVARVTSLDRLSLLFAIILGAVFLKEEVNAKLIVGGALMVAGALLIAVSAK